ncbi:phosphatidylglycerophosphatase A family protein [Coxiella endosymbiont of Amblyomma nuttalli]|uniref:phosphatidylglycerophosphatase A family protein n=1 Tax=Coxiella endosymbiont of Amblyomma nuttalli TaxID=2749996 RepID=UPI001BAC9B65|nr:phosphatidylglycerophosphatase A [Coxiella endosymbiont of Amblyomma nuttalli]QTS83689.1 Phosphatidylglycerophosphatase A [Coxiella endosymbiont of Amblyomma nuttalli]
MNIFNIFSKKNNVPRSIWRSPLEFIACGFGIGAIPWVPGTFGTLVGVILYLLLSRLSLLIYCVVTLFLFILGVIISDITNQRFNTSDHSAVVWDEIVGFLIVMIAIPKTGYFILAGFFLFRIFDIWKPWPIQLLEKNLKGGLGVMIDDVIAALYTWIVLMIRVYFA